MLFHVTITHTVDECPGYNPEKMPEFVKLWENREAVAEQCNVKLHFLVDGLPEHVAFALIEADSPMAVAQFLMQTLAYKAEFKVTPVERAEDLAAGIKAMLDQA